VLILIFLFIITMFIGAVTRWYVIRYMIRLGDYILHRIPFVNSIYKTSQDVMATLFSSNKRAFKQVVLVPFPDPQNLSLGLITRNSIPGLDDPDRMAVFVPTTPNPTSGFLLLFKRQEVTYLDMTVEDAFKYILSCGVIYSKFNVVPPNEVVENTEDASILEADALKDIQRESTII
jgi:uncharacterized membrane protein